MKNCPNKLCSNNLNPGVKWFVKIGYYKPKTTNQKTPRYKCKSCGKSFSTRTNKINVNQKKPEINKLLFKLLVSGVSLRRSSEILGVQYNTVLNHFDYLAAQSKQLHFQHLKSVETSFVQVDELETFIHSRAKCLSVAMLVRVKTGEILGFTIAKMPSKGKLASIGASKYNWIIDERSLKFQSLLSVIQHTFKPNITFKCDSNTSYRKWITNIVPNANLDQMVASKVVSNAISKPYDELFAINNTFARMRHDINRLARKTWSTTKAISGLENHIWLYVAWNNKYKIR